MDSRLVFFLIFAVIGAIILAFYILNRWMTWRYFKNKPPFKGFWGVLENGATRYTSESGDEPRIWLGVLGYVIFLAILLCVTFNI